MTFPSGIHPVTLSVSEITTTYISASLNDCGWRRGTIGGDGDHPRLGSFIDLVRDPNKGAV